MQDRLNFTDYMCLLFVLLLGLGVRGAYLHWAVDDGLGKPAWRVQGDQPAFKFGKGKKPPEHDKSVELNNLVENWHEYGEFKCLAPLALEQEVTAHIAPGYSWLFAQLGRINVNDEQVMRWLQAVIGALTPLCYMLFARRAFGSRRVALLTGLCAALYPFWILNIAELHDGVLATFALAVVLLLGTRGSQDGGVLTSLVFGLSLAGLVMVRAAFLPFSLVALIWFLLNCRKVNMGWLCAVLVCLGYATGLNPWIFRNYQTFGEPVPVVTSTFLHLWMGNNVVATGIDLNEKQLQASLPPARYKELLAEKNQAVRYNMLAHDVYDSITSDPKRTCDLRVQATLAYLLGGRWFAESRGPVGKGANIGQPTREVADPVNPPVWDWFGDYQAQTLLIFTLLLLFVLSFVGWRLSMSWRHQSRLAALAVFWVPLPYVLSHAEAWSGPRLPLDGVLLCLAAYALVGFERKKA